jgi:hypothetical protein
MSAGATALQTSPEPEPIDIAKMMPVVSTAADSVETAANLGPTESEIAVAAYQLWLDNGCPVGSDQEDWFRADPALKEARRDTRTEAEMVVGIRCWGHWEVWEMEWGDAHWVWDQAGGVPADPCPESGLVICPVPPVGIEG